MNEDLNLYNGGSPNDPPPQNVSTTDKPAAPAVIAFVISIFNIVSCCCCSVYLIPISMILAVITLVNKWKGKGFAIAAIILSLISTAFFVFSYAVREESTDFMTLVNEPQKYISMYEETGEVPEEFLKYNDPKYDKVWTAFGCDDLSDFYGRLMIPYLQQVAQNPLLNAQTGSSGNGQTTTNPPQDGTTDTPSETTERPDNYGEEPVNI